MDRFKELAARSSAPWELWLLRGLWLALPVLAGPAVGDVLSDTAQPASGIIEAAGWVAWFVGLLTSLVPHPISLTAGRILAPAVAATAALAATGVDETAPVLAATGYGVVLTIVALLPSVGDAMVNGSAYGSERRMALRTPGPMLFGPLQMAWLVVFVGLVGWAVALIAGHPILAVALAVVGAAAVWFGGRMLHQLGRRWVVFVPAGFVLHDLVQLQDPVLIQRASISSLGPSPVDANDELLDLSAGSLGMALEVETRKPVTFDHRRRSEVTVTSSSNIRFTPTLPGAVLTEARIRGVRINEPTRSTADSDT